MAYFEKYGVAQLLEIANLYLSPILIAKGRMNEGFKLLEKTRKILLSNKRQTWYAQSEFLLGKIYSQIATGPKPAFSTMVKNIGFLVKNVPRAGNKAEEHFTKAIELSKELGAKSISGWAYFELGLFYQTHKKNERSREYLSKAIQIFEENEAAGYLKQAQEALASLNN